jgi:hypothetical protein
VGIIFFWNPESAEVVRGIHAPTNGKESFCAEELF